MFQAEKIAVQRYCAARRKLGDGGRWKHEASRAQTANENIQGRLENGLWSQKETSLATDKNMGEIR